MSSKTKIVVFHMKEIIYTAIFAALGILLILLLLFMFLPGHTKGKQTSKDYKPGIYTASMTLNNTPLEVEVSVDKNHINSIRFANLDESVETMYPLVLLYIQSHLGYNPEGTEKSRGRLICCPGFSYPSTTRYCPPGSANTSDASSISPSVIPSTSAPYSSR